MGLFRIAFVFVLVIVWVVGAPLEETSPSVRGRTSTGREAREVGGPFGKPSSSFRAGRTNTGREAREVGGPFGKPSSSFRAGRTNTGREARQVGEHFGESSESVRGRTNTGREEIPLANHWDGRVDDHPSELVTFDPAYPSAYGVSQ